jgi:hypothetical protein
MQPAYVQRFVRFTVAVLLLLVTLLLQPHLALVTDLMRLTAAATLRYALYAVPLALLFGVPAGLWPGSRLDRVLQLPVVALTGLPAVLIGLFLLQTFGDGGAHPGWLTEAVAALVAAPWLARALRMGLAASHGKGVRPAMLACLGRVFQQSGNLIVCVLPLEGSAWTGPEALLGLAVPALLSHLLGDLLVTAAQGVEPAEPAPRPLVWWLELGAILAVGLLGLKAAGAVSALLAAAMGLAGAALLGLLGAGLGRWGRLAAPDLETPSLLAPYLAGLWLVLWLRPAWWVTMAGIGLAMAPWIAPAVRRWVSAPAALRGARGRVMAGEAVTLLARAIYVEALLGWVATASASPLRVGVAAALGVAGLNLLGAGLAAEK